MSQTFSKAPMCFPQGSYPAFLQSGKGCRVTDVDAVVCAQLERGITFSLPHPLEVEVAELLCEVIPCAEMARFSKTGSEVTSAAVRAARAFTGREKIAYGSYHGWHDWYSVTTSRDVGIPRANKELVVPFNYNDLSSLHAALERNAGEVAAVILEPFTLDEPQPGFLEELIATAHRAGALVIFDEIVSGFRVALGAHKSTTKSSPISPPSARAWPTACRSPPSSGAAT